MSELIEMYYTIRKAERVCVCGGGGGGGRVGGGVNARQTPV